MKFPRIDCYRSKYSPVMFGMTYFDRYGTLPFEISFAFGRYRLDIHG